MIEYELRIVICKRWNWKLKKKIIKTIILNMQYYASIFIIICELDCRNETGAIKYKGETYVETKEYVYYVQLLHIL